MKVTCHVGLTFHMGPVTSNQYGRVDVTFADIDTDGDLELQLGQGKAVAERAFQTAVAEVNRQAQEVYSNVVQGNPRRSGSG